MRLDPQVVRNQIAQLQLTVPELFEDGDEQFVLDMLEGETDLFALLRKVEELRAEAASMAGGCATRIAELELRQGRHVRREKGARTLMLKLMQDAGVTKVPLPEATLSVIKGREKLVIADDADVPADMRKPGDPNRTKIKEALQSGATFNWAAMVQGEPSLNVRTK